MTYDSTIVWNHLHPRRAIFNFHSNSVKTEGLKLIIIPFITGIKFGITFAKWGFSAFTVLHFFYSLEFSISLSECACSFLRDEVSWGWNFLMKISELNLSL
ncbi:MAG: hypothetical protein Ta2E_09770 [Mycoplasmoidaceae bacterium]|nr:MAG: hypothetical protein Ta2E_09770 [Mycoplasmoidaceae bacterium]